MSVIEMFRQLTRAWFGCATTPCRLVDLSEFRGIFFQGDPLNLLSRELFRR